MIMCIQNLVKFCPSILKVFSKNQFLTFFKGRNSAALGPIWPKFELIRALMHVIITCKYKKEWMKNSREKVETPFSHHNPICYHGNQWLNLAEFQTHQRSHVCNRYLQVWKGFDQEQPRKGGDIVFPIISLWGFFFRRSRAANSAVSGPSRPKFKLVRALMHVIITCKYEKDRMKNRREKVVTPFSPLQPYGSFLLPWKREFWSDLIQNQMQPFPQPNDASDKIWFWSTHWFQRYSCLKVWTHGRTDGRRLDWYTISSPCEPSAQVS